MNESSLPSIDGKIEDAEWRGAKVIKDFYIISPRSDSKDYDSTTVYIKQSRDALYFAFKWWPRAKVISKSMTRDRSTEEENEFFILLDLENKHENGYFFSFSFLNNQRDAIVYNQRYTSSEWDWIWECKSTIYREAKDGKPGYIESEVRIPVDKMQNKNTKQIGIDLELFAYRPDGSYYFYSPVPNSEVSTLKGTYEFELAYPFDEKVNLNLNLQPFAVADKVNGEKYKANVGIDANISLDKHKLKATYMTDQSTLEADPYTFSFYNRPIYLQEKRPFFSKDLDIFSTPINLFYTRSIDSIDYGANCTYRSDKFKAGFIYVKEPKDFTTRDYIAARPNFNFNNLNIGSLFIYKNDRTNGVVDRILSFDGLYRFPGTRFRLEPQFAYSFGKGQMSKALLVNFAYEGDNAGGPFGSISYDRLDPRFQSSTTFNSQVGAPNDYDEFYAAAGYKWQYFRKYFSNFNFDVAFYNNRQLSTNFIYQQRISPEFYYKINDFISVYHYFEFNRPNDYDANGNLIRRINLMETHNIKFLIGNSALYLGYEFGPYFGSFVKHPYASMDMIFFDRLAMKFTYDYRSVFDIRQHIFSAKLDWRIIPKLYLRSLYQKDTYQNLALWNTLLQYEFFAGSNVYIVMNLEGSKLQNTIRYFKVGYEFNM
jgi:hypothetical protein